MKTAIVRSRSLYSSMSRLMNLRGLLCTARRNSGRSFAMMSSTAWSNAHGECGCTVDETLIDT